MLASSVRLLQNMLLIENTDNVAQQCFQNSTAPNYPMHKTKNCHVNIWWQNTSLGMEAYHGKGTFIVR